MTNLVFERIRILSKIEKKARSIEFDQKTNLLIGENDVGKSTILKSLYHALGADVPQLSNAQWKRARAIYECSVRLGDRRFSVMRDGKFFGVFDENNQIIGRYQGVTGDKGISKFWCSVLKFRIELERSGDGGLGLAGPAFYFLPFYIDQDEGWRNTWESFSGLQQFADYRRHMLDYHLGVRPQSYYDAKAEELQIKNQINSLQKEIESLVSIETSYRRKKIEARVELDPVQFRKEIEELVQAVNAKYEVQQQVLRKMKDERSNLHSLETEISVLRRTIAELDADYKYVEDPSTPDDVECPTCGTSFENSLAARFGFLDDIDRCHQLIDERQKQLFEVREKLSGIELEYLSVSRQIKETDAILNRKKGEVTFSEMITAEGIKQLLQTIEAELSAKTEKLQTFESELELLADKLKPDRKRSKEISSFYQARMKQFLDKLDVHVLEENDYKSVAKAIKTNALGSDLPRSLLAQYFSYLHTMKKFNSFVLCPLVIDSPLQQEQDSDNINRVFKFIFEQSLPDQQLILGTVSLQGVDSKIVPKDARILDLDEKLQVLRADQYEQVFSDMEPMHETMLRVDG